MDIKLCALDHVKEKITPIDFEINGVKGKGSKWT
jgi:hypothetical protein